MQSRRRFLAASAAAITAAALPKNLIAEQLGAGSTVFTNSSLGAYTQGLLTEPNFAAATSSVFTALMPDGTYRNLTLRSAANVTLGSAKSASSAPRITIVGTPASGSAVPLSIFQLTFDVQGSSIPQGTYVLDHGTLGSFAVFLVAGQTAAGTPTCVATFVSLSNTRVTTSSPRSASITTLAPR
jgi:hypothetical protein